MKNKALILSIGSGLPISMAACSPSTTTNSQSQEILSDLTPNMRGLAENAQTESAGIVVVNNANDRQYFDDWRRALLLDKPSVLSPYPVIDH